MCDCINFVMLHYIIVQSSIFLRNIRKKKMHPRFQANRIIKMLISQVHYENIDSIDVLHLYTYNLLDHIMHFIFRELILQKPNNQS